MKSARRPKSQFDPADLPSPETEIIAKCGKLPLALALCGGMVQGGAPWQDVLDALKDHDLPYISTPHPAEEQHRNVWTAMNVSLRILSEEQKDRFAELAVFGLDTDTVDAAVATLWEHTAGMTPRNARKLIADFVRRSLVRVTATDGGNQDPEQRIVLHDLLHNFATGMAIKRFGSEVATHTRLVDAYRGRCPEGWASGPSDGYFFKHLCKHLIGAEYHEELLSALMDDEFVAAQIAASGAHQWSVDSLSEGIDFFCACEGGNYDSCLCQLVLRRVRIATRGIEDLWPALQSFKETSRHITSVLRCLRRVADQQPFSLWKSVTLARDYSETRSLRRIDFSLHTGESACCALGSASFLKCRTAMEHA